MSAIGESGGLRISAECPLWVESGQPPKNGYGWIANIDAGASEPSQPPQHVSRFPHGQAFK